MFATRPLASWLRLFEDEDVAVGPVATLEEAATEFASRVDGHPPRLGEHTGVWRRELGPIS